MVDLPFSGSRLPPRSPKSNSRSVISERTTGFLAAVGRTKARHLVCTKLATREADGPRSELGPDVVDRVPEDSYLEFHLGSESGWAIWPDSIHCSPSAAGSGTIETGDHPPEPALVGDRRNFGHPAPPPPPEPEATAFPEEEPVDVEPGPDEPAARRKSSPVLWILVLLLLVAVALGVYFLVKSEDEAGEPEQPVPSTDCSDAGFTGRLNETSEAQFSTFVECGGEVSEAMAYRVLDRLVATGFGPALFMYGQMYDAAATADLPYKFNPNPAIAAEYYARALAAGHAEADEALRRTCSGLSLDDELHAMAHETHCP